MKDFEDATIRRVGDATSSVDRTLREILSEPLVVSVMDFGAVQDWTEDSLPAFQAAANYVLAQGGGTIYVPPSLTQATSFMFSAPLYLPDLTEATRHSQLKIVGEASIGNEGSKIVGNFDGGIIHSDYELGYQILKKIYGLRIINQSAGGIAIIWNNAHMGVIEQVSVFASGIGIMSNNESYQLNIRNCHIHGSGYNGIGVFGGQINVSHSSIVGWNVGVRSYNAAPTINDCRFENNRIALQPGLNVKAIVTATASGTTLEVEDVHYLYPGATLGVDMSDILGGWGIDNEQYNRITGGSGTTFTTLYNTYADSTVIIMASNETPAAYHIKGLSFEQNDIGMDIRSVSFATIEGAGPQGVVGCIRDVATGPSGFSWSSAAGGTATCTTAQPHYWTGTRGIVIQGADPSGYNVAMQSGVTATMTGANTFTYPLAVNPGTHVASNVANYGPYPRYGFRVRNSSNLVFNGCHSSCEMGGFDLYCDGNTSGSGATFVGCGGTWVDAPGNMKAVMKFVNCTGHEQVLLFANLPGESDDPPSLPTAVMGMEYWISNGSGSFGGTATGGGSTVMRVTYNGTNWIRTG